MSELEKILDKTMTLACKICDYDESNMTSNDFMEAFDIMKDTAETMMYLAKAKNLDVITDAMIEHESEYGVSWDERGIKRYAEPDIDYKMDMAMYKLPEEEIKELDEKHGVHYYSEMSKLEKARKHYHEMHDMESLEHLLNAIKEEIMEESPTMSENEKTMTKTKLTNLVGMIG